MGEYDIFKTLPTHKIEGLLDGKGFVELTECNPRICPIGRTSEYIVAKSARISYAKDELMLKSINEDNGLLKYLYTHDHSSPFEMVDFSFHIRAPIFVVRQWMRHRAASYNEMSMRYVEVGEENSFYDPLQFERGIRFASTVNKQGSESITDESKISKIESILVRANDLSAQIHDIYHELLNAGLAREIARGYLPVGEYTHFIYKVNLRNLLGFLHQRCDEHAQLEIQVYANAIKTLITPLVPVVMACFNERVSSISLTENEIAIMKGEKELESIKSKRERDETKAKIEKLSKN